VTDYIARRVALHAIKDVPHQRLIDAAEGVYRHYELACQMNEPSCIAVRGKTGSGKTTLVRKVKEMILAEPHDSSTKPVVYLELPEDCTRKMVLGRILEAVDDDDPYGSTGSVLLARVQDAMRSHKVRLIIIDEVQHLVSKENKRVNHKMADLLKVLIDTVGVPFVLVGNTDLDHILSANQQLQRRMFDYIRLTPFDLGDRRDSVHFRAFLRLFDARLPFPEWCELDDAAVAAALHDATEGLIGFIVQLLKNAGDRALREGCRRIEPKHLAAAWRAVRKPFVTRKDNPFTNLVQPAPRLKQQDDLKKLKAA